MLWAGFVKNPRQLESRIHARLAEFGRRLPLRAGDVSAPIERLHNEGETSLLKVLVPVDGSPNALRAVQQTIGEYRRHHELEVHLLNV